MIIIVRLLNALVWLRCRWQHLAARLWDGWDAFERGLDLRVLLIVWTVFWLTVAVLIAYGDPSWRE